MSTGSEVPKSGTENIYRDTIDDPRNQVKKWLAEHIAIPTLKYGIYIQYKDPTSWGETCIALKAKFKLEKLWEEFIGIYAGIQMPPKRLPLEAVQKLLATLGGIVYRLRGPNACMPFIGQINADKCMATNGTFVTRAIPYMHQVHAVWKKNRGR